uniref:Tail protein n=1 Tax=viral metagenome TaxID=1070528 RepID=A0A6M3IYI2_9ZZZZ
MTLLDTNSVIRKYLTTASAETNPLIALVGGIANPRIYCPRLPENTILPAVGFFTRGGTSTPYIPDIPTPSVQFDCWAKDSATEKGSVVARNVYRKLYDALQGIQNIKVSIGGVDYYILSAREEVQGQDLVDNEIQNYFRVLTFFEIKVR